MYIPNQFMCDDRARLNQFIRSYSLAIVVNSIDGDVFASHLPLILDVKNNQLVGHMAKANKHWRYFKYKNKSLCIFQGPHIYISPTYYKDPINVPTWNYSAVHVYGEAKIIDDNSELNHLIEMSVDFFEKENGTTWNYSIPKDYKNSLMKEIVGFKIEIEEIQGKIKMSQNKSREDLNYLKENLKPLNTDQATEVISLIDEFSS